MTRHALLRDLPVGDGGRVTGIALPPAEAHWLRAVGLFEGMHVLLLRRAPLGGPLHLRTGSGAEFAVDRGLAGAVSIDLSSAPEGERGAERAMRHAAGAKEPA